MQVPRPGVRALQPVGIDVIGRKAHVAFAGINELPDGPAVGVILGAAGGALVQVWNQALARKPGSAIRVYQPEPDSAQVSTDEAASVPPPPPQQQPDGRWRWLILPVCALAAGALVYYQFYVPSRYLPEGNRSASLAVVPFECLCAGMDGDRFSQGFDEVLVADLWKLSGVQVISPSTVRRHQRMGVSMGLMGRLLGLEVLIEGTVQKLDERLRITARLVDVHTGRLIWAETYDERADDPGGAQEAVGRAVAAEVGKRLSVPSKR